MKNTNELLEVLNAIGPQWGAQFEKDPGLTVIFAANAAGMLLLNDEAVCSVNEVDPSSVYVDAEFFGFHTTAGQVCHFRVVWPFGGTPEISPWSAPAAAV